MIDFVTLSTRKVADNKLLSMLAYGAPDRVIRTRCDAGIVAWKRRGRIPSVGARLLHPPRRLARTTIAQSGNSDGFGNFWYAQAAVHYSANVEWSDDPAAPTSMDRPAGPIAPTENAAAPIRKHINWIEEISIPSW